MSDLKPIVEQIRQATDYHLNAEILRERILTKMHITHNGGMFRVTPELLAFVKTWPVDTLYLEDVFHNPTEVDRQVFLVTAQQHYQEVMNEWHQQHAELKRIRKI